MLIKIRKWLQENNYDGIIITRRDNYAWLTSGAENHVLSSTETGVASLYITVDDAWIFADSIDAGRMKDEQNPLGAKVMEIAWYESMEMVIKETIAGKKVVSDTGMINTQNVQPQLIWLRMPLSEAEVIRYRKVGRECAEIVEQTCFEARPGQTENEIAGIVKSRCTAKGISPDCVLVGSDERIMKYRHPMPTGKCMKNSLMVVLGGAKYGLNISITRMKYFDHLPDEIAGKYKKLQEIFVFMQLLMEDGMKGSEYFCKIQELYQRFGYPGEWQRHHQGGPTGYACREEIIRPDSRFIIRKGQAYAWNPTITGVKCEETTYCTDSGIEVFTRTKQWPVRLIETAYGEMDVAEILVEK